MELQIKLKRIVTKMMILDMLAYYAGWTFTGIRLLSTVCPPITFFHLTEQVNRFLGKALFAVKKAPLFYFFPSVSINFFFCFHLLLLCPLPLASPSPKLLSATALLLPPSLPYSTVVLQRSDLSHSIQPSPASGYNLH